MNDSLDKLKSLLKLSDELVKRNEFVVAFQHILKIITTIETELIKKINSKISDTSSETEKMRSQFQQAVKDATSANDSTFATLKARSMESIDAMFRKMDVQGKMSEMYAEHEAMMTEMEAKMPDTEKMMAEMLAKVPEKTPEQIRDSLESIQEEEEKLAISAIAHLEEKLKDLEKKSGMSRGSIGGFNYGALQLHIIDDETPVGTIDGINTTFTIKNPPNPVSSLKVYLNGQRMRTTEDYTFSGNTITFITAPPSTSVLLVDYRI